MKTRSSDYQGLIGASILGGILVLFGTSFVDEYREEGLVSLSLIGIFIWNLAGPSIISEILSQLKLAGVAKDEDQDGYSAGELFLVANASIIGIGFLVFDNWIAGKMWVGFIVLYWGSRLCMTAVKTIKVIWDHRAAYLEHFRGK